MVGFQRSRDESVASQSDRIVRRDGHRCQARLLEHCSSRNARASRLHRHADRVPVLRQLASGRVACVHLRATTRCALESVAGGEAHPWGRTRRCGGQTGWWSVELAFPTLANYSSDEDPCEVPPGRRFALGGDWPSMPLRIARMPTALVATATRGVVRNRQCCIRRSRGTGLRSARGWKRAADCRSSLAAFGASARRNSPIISEFEDYLDCGRLEAGCLLLECRSCWYSQLVAFTGRLRRLAWTLSIPVQLQASWVLSGFPPRRMTDPPTTRRERRTRLLTHELSAVKGRTASKRRRYP